MQGPISGPKYRMRNRDIVLPNESRRMKPTSPRFNFVVEYFFEKIGIFDHFSLLNA